MPEYTAYFNGAQTEIQAKDLYAAKLKAVEHFKPRKSQQHMVSVVLVRRDDGSSVELSHSNADL